jgi:hypothetical protein
MKKHEKILTRICVALAVVSIVWLGFNSSMYLKIPELFIRPKIYIILMTLGLLFFFISQMVIILSTILSLKKSPGMSLAGIILIALGVVSIIFLLFHFVAFDQLEEDFQYKDPYNSMLKLAWLTELVLFSFFLYSFIYFIVLGRAGNKYITTKSVSWEQIFVAMNITGIVCGIAGILLVLLFSQTYHGIQIPVFYKIVPYFFVLSPYLLALCGWGIRYYRDRRSGWYDEKLSSNINRSGMLALLASLGLTIGLVILNFHKISTVFYRIDITGVITVFLLPFYCFVVLLLFSATALYKFRNN